MSKEKKYNPLKQPIELNIASITQKGFNKETIELNQNDAINISKDEIIELDITVDYLL